MKKKMKKFEKKNCVMLLPGGGGRKCPNGHFPQYKYA